MNEYFSRKLNSCSKFLNPEYINEMFQLRPLNNTLQSLKSSTTVNYVLPSPHKELFKQSLIYFHKNCIKGMKGIQT